MAEFIEIQPTLENYWRSIILFGQNVASYKFALGLTLIELAGKGQDFIPLNELAAPFAHHICQHLEIAPKQGTSKSSTFLDTCRKFNLGEIREEELIDATAKKGFNNVIDAFHVVNGGEIPKRFFVDERNGKVKGIRLTDELFGLGEHYQFQNLPCEVDARWRLVEAAWELNLPRTVLTVNYDPAAKQLFAQDHSNRRRQISACRDALNGYQKGKCFYCFADISISGGSGDLADVDHFFPHALKPFGFGGQLDGVWNLVLSCQGCNRGPKGKFAQLPELRFVERLHSRNSFYIGSHHPLRETLMAQTGDSETKRKNFLQTAYSKSKKILIQTWKPEFEHEPAF